MRESQKASNISAGVPYSLEQVAANNQSGRVISRVRANRRIFAGLAVASLAFASLCQTGCVDETSQKPAEEAAAKPAEPAVPEDIQAAAQNLLGKETQVLVFGDLAKTGKQQFLAANVVPKNPKNPIPGTIVTRAVLAEKTDDQWSELLRCDEYLKNSKGYLAMTPLSSVAGWRIQYDQDPVKGIQLYFTPIKGSGASDPHLLPIGVAWNPATKRYQSLDRTYEHFLLETPSLSTARSVLR
ncbi:MAG: hypothetical protein WA765_04405 [Candidatus Acidiferrum sp.]